MLQSGVEARQRGEETIAISKQYAVDRLFNARAIALVGASPDATKLSSSPLKALANLGYKGKVVAVNPRYDEVGGHPCVPTITALPDGIDAAMILLSANLAVEAVEECARKGILAVVIVAQGFGESGPEGKAREKRLSELADQYGLAICGPNTNGLANIVSGLALSFAPIFQFTERVFPGPVSVISQSGAMVGTLFSKLLDRGVGIAKTATCGNELSLTVADYLEFVATDPDTKAVVVYLEGIRDAAALRHALRACRQNGKPVIAMKTGSSETGKRAALSHTGAIAGSYRNTLAFLRSEGTLVAEDLETLAALADIVTRHKWPLSKPAKPCVISISGGFAVHAADAMTRLGIELPALSDTAAARLAALPTQSHPINPYDIANQNALIPQIFEIFREDGFNQVLFGNALLKDEHRDPMRPVIADAQSGGIEQVYVIAAEPDSKGNAYFRSRGLSVSTDLDPLLKALRIINEQMPQARDTGPAAAPASTLRDKDGLLDEARSKAILASLGAKVPASITMSGNFDPARLSGLKRPIVMKGLSDRIAHKSEHGLVALGLRSDADVAAAYERITASLKSLDHDQPSVLAEELIEGGVEAIVGIYRDPVVGPVVIAGAGGILAELVDDVAILLPPFDAGYARRAIAGTKFGTVLTGFRGKRFDIDALSRLVVEIGDLSLREPRIASLDINPVIVGADQNGVTVVDAKIEIREGNG